MSTISPNKAYYNLVVGQSNQIDQLQDLVRRLRLRIKKLKHIAGKYVKVDDDQDDSSENHTSEPPLINNNFLEQILAQSQEKRQKDKYSSSSDEKVKQCRICNKTYINKKGYQKHLKRKHLNQVILKKKFKTNNLEDIKDDMIVVKPEV